MRILESILCHTPEKCLVCASNFDSKLGSLLLMFNNIVVPHEEAKTVKFLRIT